MHQISATSTCVSSSPIEKSRAFQSGYLTEDMLCAEHFIQTKYRIKLGSLILVFYHSDNNYNRSNFVFFFISLLVEFNIAWCFMLERFYKKPRKYKNIVFLSNFLRRSVVPTLSVMICILTGKYKQTSNIDCYNPPCHINKESNWKTYLLYQKKKTNIKNSKYAWSMKKYPDLIIHHFML